MSEPSLTTQHPVLDLPPSLILEVALGADSVETICANYGYNPEQTESTRGSKYFWKIVKDQEAELDKNGLSFRLRAKRVTEDMIGRLWPKAKTNEVPFADKLDFLKLTAKLADLEPKQNQTIPGTGFSITFNLGGTSAQITRPEPLDITPTTADFMPSLSIPPRAPIRPTVSADHLKVVSTYTAAELAGNGDLDYEEQT